MEADEEGSCTGEAGAPADQAVVGVDEVELLAPQKASQAPRGGQVLALAGREFEAHGLDPAALELVDLIAHPATPLWRACIGHEVGDDQHAHRG